MTVVGAYIAAIFFKKMQADIYRYLAQHTKGEEKNRYRDKAWAHYKYAEKLSENLKTVRASHFDVSKQKDMIESVRVGLVMNYAVFLYEVVQTEDQKKVALRKLKKQI